MRSALCRCRRRGTEAKETDTVPARMALTVSGSDVEKQRRENSARGQGSADMACGDPLAPSCGAGWGGFLEEVASSSCPGWGPRPTAICFEILEKPLPSLIRASRQWCERPEKWGGGEFAVSQGRGRGQGDGPSGHRREEPPLLLAGEVLRRGGREGLLPMFIPTDAQMGLRPLPVEDSCPFCPLLPC